MRKVLKQPGGNISSSAVDLTGQRSTLLEDLMDRLSLKNKAAAGIKEEERAKVVLSQRWHDLKHQPQTHTGSSISIFVGTLISLHLVLDK